ncbi:hypothetical protein CN918_28175 [Priestia megaterium]|nr:hypothetical protein CN918_28175 [Priestia megaterium]
MKKLYVTNEIPENAAILLVDLQKDYIDEALDIHEGAELRILKKRIDEKLNKMKTELKRLKEKGHPILAIGGHYIYPGFEGLPDVNLPEWQHDFVQPEDKADTSGGYILDPQIVEEVNKYSRVVVCGLWKEICVCIVARSLQEKFGKNVPLLDDSTITLENALVWLDDDVVTLERICEDDNVKIVNV